MAFLMRRFSMRNEMTNSAPNTITKPQIPMHASLLVDRQGPLNCPVRMTSYQSVRARAFRELSR